MKKIIDSEKFSRTIFKDINEKEYFFHHSKLCMKLSNADLELYKSKNINVNAFNLDDCKLTYFDDDAFVNKSVTELQAIEDNGQEKALNPITSIIKSCKQLKFIDEMVITGFGLNDDIDVRIVKGGYDTVDVYAEQFDKTIFEEDDLCIMDGSLYQALKKLYNHGLEYDLSDSTQHDL